MILFAESNKNLDLFKISLDDRLLTNILPGKVSSQFCSKVKFISTVYTVESEYKVTIFQDCNVVLNIIIPAILGNKLTIIKISFKHYLLLLVPMYIKVLVFLFC